MKNNRKISKLVISLFTVVILIVILFFFLQKFTASNDADNKNKNTIKTEDVDKNSQKTSAENPETLPGKTGEEQTSVTKEDTKKQEEAKATNAISSEQGIAVFVKEASFGSAAKIIFDSSKLNESYKYYQFFLENKPISNMESITKIDTTIFPAQEADSEVVLSLLDGNKKVLKKLNVILNEKK